jgi:two-component system sensor histidine kinase VicK
VSDKECLVPEFIHKSEKPASQIIYSNVRETVKQQQYVFETLWNKAVSAQDKIDEIEKGKLPEITEIIRNPAEVRRLAYKLVASAAEEILLIFASVNAFMRHVSPRSPASSQLLVEAAKYRNVSVRILTPMNELTQKIARGLASQSTNIQIRGIGPASRYTVTVVLVDRKHVTATELKDDSKLDMEEAIGATTYSTSKSIVLSYVSMFENFMRLIDLYEESQSKLIDTTDELETIKKYLNEVLEEVDKFKKKE